MCSGKSATSSRNSVPPSAERIRPSLSATAPVKLPFLWPNSSLSISSDGIAPQFTGTNGPSCRGPVSWMSRATSSLPVPESPQMCTGAWLRATLAIICRSCCIGFDWPSNRKPDGVTMGCVTSNVALSFGRSFSVDVISLRNAARSSGLEMKSKAPSFSARTAASTLPCAVMTATGTPGRWCWIQSTMSSPFPSGSFMSVSTRSNRSGPSALIALA